jgi:hypothetical protein
MGGVVSGVGNLIGGAANAVGSVINPVASIAGRLPVIGPVAGPVVGGIMGGPAGFASSLAGQALTGGFGGGGGSSGSSGGTSGGTTTPLYAQPNVSYGTNTYQANGTPIDTSKYFITGDRGVYNLLPALGAISSPIGSNVRLGSGGKNLMGKADKYFGANVYTPYEAYQDIRTQMANDPTALAAFNKLYTPSAYDVALRDKLAREGRGQTTTTTPSPLAAFNTANPFPYQYVDYGLRGTAVPGSSTYAPLSYNALANYAYKNQNPFFMPFQTTTGATASAFTPTASYLAADTTNPYYTKLQSAMTAQQAAIDALRGGRGSNLERGRPDHNRPGTTTGGTTTGTGTTTGGTTTGGTTTGTGTTTGGTTTGGAIGSNSYGIPPTTPVTPPSNSFGIPTPGNFVPMRRGGIAALRRK